eukprot:Tamp_10770.p1 GENE.Tamp_10770~~Tamp_10770.p1  ORF type:complete len:428 (-),score=72.49 Tamp_10770:308-1591(-)
MSIEAGSWVIVKNSFKTGFGSDGVETMVGDVAQVGTIDKDGDACDVSFSCLETGKKYAIDRRNFSHLRLVSSADATNAKIYIPHPGCQVKVLTPFRTGFNEDKRGVNVGDLGTVVRADRDGDFLINFSGEDLWVKKKNIRHLQNTEGQEADRRRKVRVEVEGLIKQGYTALEKGRPQEGLDFALQVHRMIQDLLTPSMDTDCVSKANELKRKCTRVKELYASGNQALSEAQTAFNTGSLDKARLCCDKSIRDYGTALEEGAPDSGQKARDMLITVKERQRVMSTFPKVAGLDLDIDIQDLEKQFVRLGIKKETDLQYLDEEGLKKLSVTHVSRAKIQNLTKGLFATTTPSDGDSAGGSEIEAWLRKIGIAEDDISSVLLHFNKPEYGVKTLRELFALEEGDINEVLQPLPLAKKRLLKMHIQDEKCP